MSEVIMNIDPNAFNSASQCVEVLHYLKSGARITSGEAIQRWGITRLAARVYELRQRGWPIESVKVQVRNRNGRSVWVESYWLGAGE